MWTSICQWCGHVTGSWTAPEPQKPVTIPANRRFWRCACGRLTIEYPEPSGMAMAELGGVVRKSFHMPTQVSGFTSMGPFYRPSS